MRGILLFIILIFTTYLANGQDTWFKVIPGWEAVKTVQIEDTFINYASGIKDGFNDYVFVNYLDSKRVVIKTDTLDYSAISNKPSGNLLFNDYLIDSESKTFGLTYHIELPSGNYIRNCDIFTYPDFQPLSYSVNVDTFQTTLIQYESLNKNKYGLITWYRAYEKNGGTVSDVGYRLLRFNLDTTTVLKEVFNIYSNPRIVLRYEKLYGDNQDSSNIFLKRLYDVNGNTYKTEIDLLDSTGKVLWTCRPDASDSFNTTNLQIVQKPNGNLLCSWTNYYYSSGKKPGGHPYLQEYNENMTPHFAEIDYETGKVLWVNNQQQFMDWNINRDYNLNPAGNIEESNHDILWIDAKLINNNEVLWVGSKKRYYKDPVVYKFTSVIYKTDINGNPIWYREHEIYPGTGSKNGFTPKSFIILPKDSGILLTGEYKGASGQQAALFKLDKNGCREQDCGKYDGIEELEKENNNSLINLYPNPAKDIVVLEWKGGFKETKVILLDINGRVVLERDWKEDTKMSINTSTLSRGNYFIHIKDGEELKVTRKLVILN